MISWEAVRGGIQLAKADHGDGTNIETSNAEVGDVVISIIKDMSADAVEVHFNDVMAVAYFGNGAGREKNKLNRYK